MQYVRVIGTCIYIVNTGKCHQSYTDVTSVFVLVWMYILCETEAVLLLRSDSLSVLHKLASVKHLDEHLDPNNIHDIAFS